MKSQSTSADGPRIMIKGAAAGFGSFSELGKALARADPIVRLAAGFSAVADKQFMSSDLCLINLSRHVGEAVRAQTRGQWFGGRLYNRLAGISPDYVTISGAVLTGSMRYLGQDVPAVLDRRLDYLLRLDFAQELLGDSKQKARAEGMIK